MPALTFRNALPADAPRCFEIETTAYEGDEAATLEKIATRIAQYPQGFLILEANGEVVGFINCGCAHDVVMSDEAFKALVGHSAEAPNVVIMSVVVDPSPRYIDEDSYIGGFKRGDIDDLLDTLDSNYLGWSSSMAPVIMGAPEQPALGEELTKSFCRTEPDIAKQFARVTFMSDNRQDVIGLTTPVLILQSIDDLIAPIAVGEYLHSVLPNSVYCLVDNVGHCPHMSAPQACAAAMDSFLTPWAAARAN